MKTERLNLRISSENLAVVRHKAKKANMTLTDYVTKVAMGKEIVIITDLAEVLRELKAVGRNLNQLATLSNMGRVQAVNLTETLECFTQINQSLQEILERRRWSA
ncbi:MAG: MobC family plasmid mobilization relaxosome protein [Clostridiales bacterium]|nr:MobC family plasmid mobilization relaxosome protein [Clostridiales bacterium]